MNTSAQTRKIDIYLKISLITFVLFVIRSFYVLIRLGTLDARQLDQNISQELKLMAVTAVFCGALAFFARFRAIKLRGELSEQVKSDLARGAL